MRYRIQNFKGRSEKLTLLIFFLRGLFEIAYSFSCIYIKENFEGTQLYYQNINKLKGKIISIIVCNINYLNNTKFIYWKIYRDFLKLYFQV